MAETEQKSADTTDLEKMLEISPLLSESFDRARKWVFIICGPSYFLAANEISPSLWPAVGLVFKGWADIEVWRLVFTLNILAAIVYFSFFIEHLFSFGEPYTEFTAYKIRQDGSIGPRVFHRRIISNSFLIKKKTISPTRLVPKLMVGFRRLVFKHIAPTLVAALAVWTTYQNLN